MSFVAGTLPALIGVAGGLVSSNQAKKAAQGAAGASQVDINALDENTRAIALNNAAQSAELERLMTPEVPQLRTDANNQVLQQMNPSAWDAAAQNMALGSSAPVTGARTPLLQAAIDKAKANLAMGGRLSAETQNAVTRAGLAKAGTVAQGGLGLGRDVVARDLGLTSLDLENQRLQQASQLGGQELAMAGEANNTAFNNKTGLINTAQLLQQIQQGQYGRSLSAAQYAQSIAQPVVGLDPSSAANIAVGNSNNLGAALSNKANIAGQQSQNYMNLAGQLGGYALLNYNRSSGTSPYITGTSPYITGSSGFTPIRQDLPGGS